MSISQYFDGLMDWLGQHPLQWTIVIVAGAVAMMVLVHFLARSLQEERYGWQRRLRNRLAIKPGEKIGELRWLLLVLHTLLWPQVAYVVLRIWGLHDEGRDFLATLFSHGIAIGSMTLVPGKLMIGVLWFVVLFTFTRWLKKKIEFDWLVRTGIEAGTRAAVATLFGYVTFVIAALVGLSVAGLDFTKVAIVAGALSVGIGFGLQNIVNNFVSGLILLFERLVTRGDYIVVGQTQGFVRRIRIRSTQIETVDRELVIVPNSDLLSTHLRRLNLRDGYGNVSVPVSVAYGSDPEQVKRVLLEVAAAHPKIAKAGERRGVSGPSVAFVNFAASTLDFELRGQVAEGNTRGTIASDLRFAINAAFREVGIEMPFPQQDVWIRGLPESLPGGLPDAKPATVADPPPQAG